MAANEAPLRVMLANTLQVARGDALARQNRRPPR